MIKAGVVGALGKMGREVVKAISESSDMLLCMAVDIQRQGEDVGEIVLNKSNGVLVYSDLEKALVEQKPDVVIDFTQPSTIYQNAKTYLKNKINCVIGTTGLKEEQIQDLKKVSEENQTACLIAPNFSLGAVLMMQFAQKAAKYFNNAEIIELHHNQKKDAPSGTAIKTAQLMAESNTDFTLSNCPETETIQGARGANASANVHIHSVRMPGYIASQEVIFGASGQILTIRHDSMDRTCYMSGVLMAARYVAEHKEFIYGLENIL